MSEIQIYYFRKMPVCVCVVRACARFEYLKIYSSDLNEPKFCFFGFEAMVEYDHNYVSHQSIRFCCMPYFRC